MSQIEADPTIEEWRDLYSATQTIKAMAPWRWMTETDLFGLIDPETDTYCMLSVMGMLGDHLSIALYIGPNAIHNVLTLFLYKDEEQAPELLLTAHHLQASFENRDHIEKEDYAVIKQLGLKFRGKQAWPQFRSYRPGFAPYFMTGAEARLLTHALEQLALVAPRWQTEPDNFPSPKSGSMLVRFKNKFGWSEENRLLPQKAPLVRSTEIPIDPEIIPFLMSIPQQPMTLEVDCFMMLGMSVGEQGERPIIPYNLLLVDHDSGMALGSEILNPAEGLNAMWAMVPMMILITLANAGVRPEKMWTTSQMLFQVFEPTAKELGITLEMVFDLPMLGHAKSMMMHYLGGSDALM